jgi:hypothetical protein
MRITFPLIMATGFQADNGEWLRLIRQDAAALHITAFSIEGFIERILRRRENSINLAAMLHLRKGLRLLRERLLGEDDDKKVSDSTAAHFIGDYQVFKQHMEGLRKMVDLRGGLDIFKGKQVLVEMLR